MKAEILSVGSELLLGELIDTNSSYLASELPALGIDLYWISTVGDNKARLVEALRRAWGRSQLILLTGGLGPTEDDLTREAIAEMLGEELWVDPELERGLRDFFASRGYAMPERNIKQATLIPSAQALPNPRGTAPGWWVEKEGRSIVAMPGPPHEMEHMWQKEVLPRLKPRLGGEIIISRTLKTFGLGESLVDELMSPFLSSPNPTMGIYAKTDGVHLRLTAKARTEEEARKAIREREEKVRKLLGERVWGADNDTLGGVVGRLLTARGLTLATMESCTGGLLASTITDVPGSSGYFKGGLVAYTNEMKVAFGVDPRPIQEFGAISPQVAQALATTARQKLEADIGIGITGVAGPEEVEGKPVGTVHIAIDLQGQISSFSLNYRFTRPRIKRLAVNAALFNLQKALSS